MSGREEKRGQREMSGGQAAGLMLGALVVIAIAVASIYLIVRLGKKKKKKEGKEGEASKGGDNADGAEAGIDDMSEEDLAKLDDAERASSDLREQSQPLDEEMTHVSGEEDTSLARRDSGSDIEISIVDIPNVDLKTDTDSSESSSREAVVTINSFEAASLYP